MSFPQSRYAYADMDHPREWFFCDRCGFRKMKDKSVFQRDWRGTSLANLHILVCSDVCLDEFQEQERTILIGPDPIPVRDPRPGWQTTQAGFGGVSDILELVDGDIPGGTGVGLRNTRERLRELYGSHHSFRLESSDPSGLTIHIRVPYQIQQG